MLRHVAGVAEIVENFDEAVTFYRDVLGFEVEEKDGDDYAMVTVPGVLHFGIWNRAHAAECTFGSREHADRIPLGFTLEFEVDSVNDTASDIERAGHQVVQAPRLEPWGQKSFRMISPSGSILGYAETPWARRITKPMETAECDTLQND